MKTASEILDKRMPLNDGKLRSELLSIMQEYANQFKQPLPSTEGETFEQKAEWQREWEVRLNELPENRPLYKDSGLWQIRTDDMETVLFQQEVNESFSDFITRAEK